MQRRQPREKQQQQEQRVDLYNVVRDWEARERERDLFPGHFCEFFCLHFSCKDLSLKYRHFSCKDLSLKYRVKLSLKYG
jgi:hypothetical protein